MAYGTTAKEIPCDLAKNSLNELLPDYGFDTNKLAFGSLLGISYYLTKEEFKGLIGKIAAAIPAGSVICMDYPCTEESTESERTRKLADAAGEQMKARYTEAEMKELLEANGFVMREHLNAVQMTEQFFRDYNVANPEHAMAAPEGVAYVVAVKKSAAF